MVVRGDLSVDVGNASHVTFVLREHLLRALEERRCRRGEVEVARSRRPSPRSQLDKTDDLLGGSMRQQGGGRRVALQPMAPRRLVKVGVRVAIARHRMRRVGRRDLVGRALGCEVRPPPDDHWRGRLCSRAGCPQERQAHRARSQPSSHSLTVPTLGCPLASS